MAPERLSRLQRRNLAWLLVEAQRTRGATARHADLVRALAHDKGNLSTSLKGLEAKGLVTIARTPGGKAEAIALTAEGGEPAEVVNKDGIGVLVAMDDVTAAALQAHAERHGRTPAMQIRLFVWEYLARMGVVMVLFLALMTPAWATTPQCTTYPQPRLSQLYILCDDGTRIVSYWHRTLKRWETAVLPPPGTTCTGQLNPKTHQWEGRCR
jgi:DNA-binding MarR family transcriptional regulator